MLELSSLQFWGIASVVIFAVAVVVWRRKPSKEDMGTYERFAAEPSSEVFPPIPPPIEERFIPRPPVAKAGQQIVYKSKRCAVQLAPVFRVCPSGRRMEISIVNRRGTPLKVHRSTRLYAPPIHAW